MFDDTESAILPRTPEDCWSSWALAFGFHGVLAITLLLTAVLVVRPVSVVPPLVPMEFVLPVEIESSGSPPPHPAPEPPGRSSDSLPAVVLPEPLAMPEVMPAPSEPLVEPPEAFPAGPWDAHGLELGPGVSGAGPGFGTGPGDGSGNQIGDGPGTGGGEPLELTGSIDPPALLVRVEPVYPHVARMAGIQGRVLLRAVIGTNGSVERVEVVSSPHVWLSEAAEEAVLRWRYRPAGWRGKPVRVWFTVRVEFVLR